MQAAFSVSSYSRRRPIVLLRAREEGASYEGSSQDGPRPRVAPETVLDWTRVHERIVALGLERAGHERELCRWLLAAERLGVHARVGYASLREYGDRVLGLGGRETEERLRVGRALAELPALDGALASGQLCWSAVRELTRIATRQSEQAWVDWAKGRRAREIEAAVAARHPGDGPRDRSDPALVKHRLRFEVRAETMAMFRDLQAAVRADLGGEVDDDALLYEIARRAMGGPGDEGRAGYQVAVSRCDECGRTRIDAGGVEHAVDPVVAEMVTCDAQVVDARQQVALGPGGASPHVGAATEPTSLPRATQTIPPAIRRHVMRRDHERCVVPGCQNHRFLDVHHVDPRSEGGSHAPERLAVLCGAHHRAVHAGSLRIDGTGSGGFDVRHANGAAYGARLEAAAIEVTTQVVGVLENLGFSHRRAHELVDAVLRRRACGGRGVRAGGAAGLVVVRVGRIADGSGLAREQVRVAGAQVRARGGA